MEQEENFFKETREQVEEYVDNTLTLLKLQAVEKTSKLIASTVGGIIIVFLGLGILFFASFLAGYYLSDLTGNKYEGFGMVAGFYVLLLLIFIIFRRSIVDKTITNTVINIFFESTKKNKSDVA